MIYGIEGFWGKRLPALKGSAAATLRGWYSAPDSLPTFQEAPLTECADVASGGSPLTSPLILVSAPGAVGKSTLARQIASKTGAIYIDLAEAEPVGANTLSGGLAKSGIWDDWQSETVAVLLDGLDEARLRVTQEAFEAFLFDVAEMAGGRNAPTVLFGRTGAVQDAWLVLSDKLSVAVLEIGYYGPEAALAFACACLDRTIPNNPHLTTGHRALKILLQRLRNDTKRDGDRFAGYAPVLLAVADRVARESNPGALISQVEKGEQPVTLQTVVEAILEREHEKLRSLSLEDDHLLSKLYRPEEQLQRLVARVYQQPPPGLPPMNPKDGQAYSAALETWLPEHPFLDGGNAASTVFEAVISTKALRTPATASLALSRELAKGAAANPFLSEFYFRGAQEDYLPPEHIGVIYASLRARLSLGDTASLQVEGAEDEDELEALRAEVEISLSRSDVDQTSFLRFDSDQTGPLRLGVHVEDVEIFAPFAKVEIGGARETVLVAPVSIQCGRLLLSTERLILDGQPNCPESAIFLEAEQAETSRMTNIPVLNGGVALSVAWPGSAAHPWTNFATAPTPPQDPRTDEGLRRFRKFVIAFRSHSKGSLKRYRAKIEHERMTKGTGQAVLKHLFARGVVTVDGAMYTLDPEKLAIETGASYLTCMSRTFPEKAVAFVEEAIAQHA